MAKSLMLTLVLNGRLLWKWERDASGETFRDDCPSIELAQGLICLCPVCFLKNDGPVGTHSVICWFQNRGIPDDVFPKPGRWNPSGTGVHDITFVPPGSTSVLLTHAGCGWHGFIQNGRATL